jgi:microcystin-dependent protein
MTVSSTTTKVSYSGDDTTTVFAYTFKIFADADLKVIVRTDATGAESTKTLTTDYTVSGAGDAGGGNVTMVVAPASGETLLIKRSLDLTQSTDYVPNDPFPAAAHEDALDRMTFIAQQQQEVFDRAVVFPETDTASTTIPDSVTRANKFLGFGASGEVAVLSSTGTSPGAIDTGNLVDGAVTTAKLASTAVTTAKITDDAITQAKIADDAVGSAQIAADAVTQAKIADDAVGSAQIADNAVGTAQIADSAVTAAKLSSDAAFSAGMLMPYAGTSAPTGWLLAYGQAVSRTTYADLFTAISTTYGSGDGSTTFNLPDLRGRTIAGQDDMGGSSANRLTNQSGGLNGDTLGASGGAETHTLTTSQMPSHSHTLGSNAKISTTFDTSGGNTAIRRDTLSGSGLDSYISGSTEAAGSGAAHNNVQPTIILNYIIKT